MGTPELRWFARLGQLANITQDAQKGQISHPPSPGGYFTHPPRVCQDSLFALGRACPKEGRSERRGDLHSVRYVEPLSEARTSHGNKRVSTPWGWEGEKSDIFSILLGLLIIIVSTLSVVMVMSGANSTWAAAKASRGDVTAESLAEPAQSNRLLEELPRN